MLVLFKLWQFVIEIASLIQHLNTGGVSCGNVDMTGLPTGKCLKKHSPPTYYYMS